MFRGELFAARNGCILGRTFFSALVPFGGVSLSISILELFVSDGVLLFEGVPSPPLFEGVPSPPLFEGVPLFDSDGVFIVGV